MAKQQTILLVTDFSECSKDAAHYAAQLALCLNMSLTLLHVVHDPACSPGYYVNKHSKKHFKKMTDVAAEMMTDFVDELQKNSSDFAALTKAGKKNDDDFVIELLVSGLPIARILQVIKKLSPAMVVMGSHGHSPLSQLILGSKAAQILRLSPVSVTIVKRKDALKEELKSNPNAEKDAK